MEKFQKYYLSVLLVILYSSHLSAQVNCTAVEGENCKKACEIFNYWGEFQGLS